MNNKGQSLVLFILIIPILISIMALVIDVGKLLTTKANQENTIKLYASRKCKTRCIFFLKNT